MQVEVKRNLIYIVKNDDTINSICAKFHMDQTELKNINKINDVQANDAIILPKPYKHCYVVKPLDTYESIAQACGVDVFTIKRVLKDQKIYIGKKILF